MKFRRLGFAAMILAVGLAHSAIGSPPPDQPKPPAPSTTVRPNGSLRVEPVAEEPTRPVASPWVPTVEDFKGLKNFALIGLVSLAPAALLMFTSFVRINIVLILLRQALGSPQVPGNQVLAALALLLTLLVMRPVGEAVYVDAIRPYAASEMKVQDVERAWQAGVKPIKEFMIGQLKRTNHDHYLNELYDVAVPPKPGRFEPTYCDEYPLSVIAPAFLLSELTTALKIGFLIYLPFLVVDLVVSAVLSAMGLFMLPPSLVAMPLKLIVFVLADGWLLVASALLRTFAV